MLVTAATLAALRQVISAIMTISQDKRILAVRFPRISMTPFYLSFVLPHSTGLTAQRAGAGTPRPRR